MDSVKQTTILITGGRSLVGSRLSAHLRTLGYRVLWLTRDIEWAMQYSDEAFYWDMDQNILAEHPLTQADVVIHLAGSTIFGERWSRERKRKILRSRVVTARMLVNKLQSVEHHVHTMIWASSLLYYQTQGDRVYANEDEPAGSGFLSRTFEMLEQEAVMAEQKLGVRSVILREGFVLDAHTGGLPNMLLPLKLGLNVPLGLGNQYINWIHVSDLCRLYTYCIEEKAMWGVYNACSEAPLTNNQFMYGLSSVYGHDHIRLPIPSPLLRFALGEMSVGILKGRPAGVDKLVQTGFEFHFHSLNQALRDLIKSNPIS